MGMKQFMLGLILGITLVGCAGFSYKYYGLNAASYEGTLLGPESKDDMPFKKCQPDDATKGKCVVMLASEFFRLKQDYTETVKRLKTCEDEN